MLFFISGGSDSFQINKLLNQNIRDIIVKPRASEVVSSFQPLEFNSERALTLAVHWQTCYVSLYYSTTSLFSDERNKNRNVQ